MSNGFLCPHGLDLCVQCMEDKGLPPGLILDLVRAYLQGRP